MSKPRVILAEDHVMVSEGLIELLKTDFTIVGSVTDGRALIQAVKAHSPDIAVIDIALPLLNGLEAARQIKKCEPHTKLIFLTMHAEEHYVTEAFQAGGLGYILKQSASTELLFAMNEVLRGRTYVSPSIARELVNRALNNSPNQTKHHEAHPVKLTQRQVEILQLVAEGKSNKDIAVMLNLAVKTVEFHKTRIMQELGLKTTSELTKYALAQGIIST